MSRPQKALVQLPDGSWIDPDMVRRVKIHFSRTYQGQNAIPQYAPTYSVNVRFRDGDWFLECLSKESAEELRDYIAKLRNEEFQ